MVYKIGDKVVSKHSHTVIVIAEVDHANRMYVDKDKRAVGFDEVYTVGVSLDFDA